MEMEGIAAYKVAKQKGKKACIIKSFCDWSDDKKRKEWQPYCADVASSFAVDYIIGHYGRQL
ncbi:MAG: hypothetical protein NUV44_09350 [Candidatus Scalindua sp.]|nr:hypothetical protein [Candidatus Scalindua sp.]